MHKKSAEPIRQTAWLRGQAADSILLRYTRIGDLTLEETVNFPDLLALAQHYGRATAKWNDGDLNYDGSVDFTDTAVARAELRPIRCSGCRRSTDSGCRSALTPTDEPAACAGSPSLNEMN